MRTPFPSSDSLKQLKFMQVLLAHIPCNVICYRKSILRAAIYLGGRNSSHATVTALHFFKIVYQVSSSGNVLQSEIVGAVKLRCYLSGMPELRLGLNDKVLFENTGSKLNIVLMVNR